MHVFVTGGSGLIGRAVIKELRSAGHTVLALARSDKSAEQLKALGAETLKGDLQNLSVLAQGAARSDGVLHLGFVHDFENWEQSCQTDRDAIQAMADALAGTDRPLVVTTGTMLLPGGRVGTEDDGYDEFSSHFSIRGKSETLAMNLALEGVRTAVIRLAPVNHGDGDDHMFITNVINAAKKNSASVYFKDGSNRWPAVHYLDAAVAYRLALEKTVAGSIYHVVAEQGVRFKDIAETIAKKLGLPAQSKSAEEMNECVGHFAAVMMTDNIVSSEKTKVALGWEPKQCTLLDDLEHGMYFS